MMWADSNELFQMLPRLINCSPSTWLKLVIALLMVFILLMGKYLFRNFAFIISKVVMVPTGRVFH
jgi:hypothetical protein